MDLDPVSARAERPQAAPTGAVPDGSATGTAGGGSRRRFLRWLGGFTVLSTLAMIVTPVLAFLMPTATSRAGGGGKVLVATTADVPPGEGKVVALSGKPVIVVDTDQGVHAFSAICTHLGCVVTWDDLAGTIECPCHDGRYNPVSGAVVSGPPPAPLPPVTVQVENDKIYLIQS